MTRYLRPGRIVRSADSTWLIDESWPVVASLHDDGSVTVQGWPWPRKRVEPELDHVAVADGVGIVVRDGDQVVWVRRDGCAVATVDTDLMLAAAGPQGAWFVDRSYVDPGDPPEPPPALSPGRIVAMRSDGTRREMSAPAPVQALDIRGHEVWVTLSEPPIAHATGDEAWEFEYPTSVLQLSESRLLTGGLTAGAPGTLPDDEGTEHDSYAWIWLETDPETVLRYGVRAGGLVWWAGAPVSEDYADRRAVAVGHDPATGRVVVRVDLGRGLVNHVQAIGDELWLSVLRRSAVPGSRDQGVDVLAISTDGSHRTVCRADTVDISRFAPRLHRPPQEQIDKDVATVRRMFADLGSYWSGEDGTVAALSDGLTDPTVTVEADWPDTRVVVTFRHPRRNGLLLRRTFAVFDDEGRPVDHEYADINLMEDLDTDHLAPVDWAVDGILDT